MIITSYKRGVRTLSEAIRLFGEDTSGVFAVVFGLMATVLIAVAGAAVDYTYWMSARSAAQQAADTAALAAAVSSETEATTLRKVAAAYVAASVEVERWPDIALQNVVFTASTDRVEVTVGGSVGTFFLGLVGIDTLPVHVISVGERAPGGRLEVAMVLDNTWSMAASDAAGTTKIAALKAASHGLLDEVLADTRAEVKVSVIPYAEYVNVGPSNRNQPWMEVAANYSTTSPRTCETRTTRSQCTKGAPKTCKRTVDGVQETYDCTPQTCTTYNVPPYQQCSGGGTTNYKWFGCVLSRNIGALRLSDEQPYTPYTGMLDTSQKCLSPIIPLTDQETTIRSAINSMVVNVGNYKPSTYIPAGLVWGINALSPSLPFNQGSAYDPDNVDPRKAMILMTDGDNTMQYSSLDGRHVAFNGSSTAIQKQKIQTDNDTDSLCAYAKQAGIEVFTVAFGQLTPQSDTLLEKCASSGKHYYNAIDAGELRAAFGKIAEMLTDVRLVQ